MQRYNIFFPIHKGLRAMLHETALFIQRTNFMNDDEAAELVKKIRDAITFFEKHAQTEDNYVFSAITAYEPSVVDAFEQEHKEDHRLGEEIQNWLLAFEYATSASAKQVIGEELSKAFTDFLVFNLKHMAKEEDIINKILWRYYSDAQLHEITLKITSKILPADMTIASKWMIKGMNNHEISTWLKEVKNNAPEPVCHSLISLAEKILPSYRWNVIEESLAEGAMIA